MKSNAQKKYIMTNIEKIELELRKYDCLAIEPVYGTPLVEPKNNALYVKGAINDKEFTCMAKEYSVFAHGDFSIIL